MKRFIIAGSIAALAFVGAAGTANAAPNDNACFGGIHKLINTKGYEGFETVGQVVQAVGGQTKNSIARGLCS